MLNFSLQRVLAALSTQSRRRQRGHHPTYKLKGLYARLTAVSVPERMPAATFVNFMVSTIVAGRPEEIWKELADMVA